MSLIKRKKSLSISLVSVLMILTVSLFLFSCAKDNSYDTSKEIAAAWPEYTGSVMIDSVTLKNWLDNGYPGDIYGNTKIVVLFVGTQDQYDAGHIPDSQFVGYGDIKADRSDGVSMTIDMVATKAQMDGVIQKTGIDGGTLIVITGPSGNFSFMNTARAYYNFRYWGFPRSKLRVLDGFVNTTWADAGYLLEFEAPTAPEPSTYSVCYLTQRPDDFRAPLKKMIEVAADSDDSTVIIDTRSEEEYNGTSGPGDSPATPGSAGPDSKEYVAFEGHIRGAQWLEYKKLLDTDNDGRLKNSDDLIAEFKSIGIDDDTKTAYPYCRTSWRAAITFLALDGVLNYPVKLYDGAWIEWGQMTAADILRPGPKYPKNPKDKVWSSGPLDADSPWRTDKVLPLKGAIIVDNSDDGYSDVLLGDANQDWLTSTRPGIGPYYGRDFAFHMLNNSDTATWTPFLPSDGEYDVYIWHTAKSTYETNASYTINHNDTSDLVSDVALSTKDGDGTWHKLGTSSYYFKGDGSENVTLTDSVSDKYVVADAVAFVPVSSPITSETPISLSKAVIYNGYQKLIVESILANSGADAGGDNVNRTDEEICAIEGPGGGGAGGGGDSGGY